MIKLAFTEYLNSITPLSPALKDELLSNLQIEEYKSHQIISASGQTENRLWFIYKGFVQAYYYDNAGKQHTLKFYQENDLVFSYNGFWRKPSDYYLETLQPSIMVSLSYKSVAKLFKYLETGDLARAFIMQQDKEADFKLKLMNGSTKERYKQFREARPEIFGKTTVGLIASYLNMTREYLSRLMSDDFN